MPIKIDLGSEKPREFNSLSPVHSCPITAPPEAPQESLPDASSSSPSSQTPPSARGAAPCSPTPSSPSPQHSPVLTSLAPSPHTRSTRTCRNQPCPGQLPPLPWAEETCPASVVWRLGAKQEEPPCPYRGCSNLPPAKGAISEALTALYAHVPFCWRHRSPLLDPSLRR